MSDGALLVGLVGAGMIGQLRAKALGAVPSLRLAAVADPRTELAEAAAKHGASVRVFADGLELAAELELDAVIIATPPNSHEQIGVACLNGGKHVALFLLCGSNRRVSD